jgi:uncharacterized NAD(P)/FAD-binding protein YdhS/quercetin dioxygenase-like cupin family protein
VSVREGEPASAAVARLVATLDAERGPLDSERLAAILRATPIELADVEPWVAFHPRTYRRNLIMRRPRYELRLLCFQPGQRTSLHAHDDSACAFRVLDGTSHELRLREPHQIWPAGAIVREDHEHLVHQVVNAGDRPLVSLHAYAPPLPVDQPRHEHKRPQIVIVGGGFSGVALATHILRRAADDIRVALIEPREQLGRGPAYGTTDPTLRLNVPADRMSLFPDEPHDFMAWAKARGIASPASALLPRALYGEYVEDRFAAAIGASSGKLWLYRGEATRATRDGVWLADGTELPASTVVLATGNQQPAALSVLGASLSCSPRVIRDPWSTDALRAIDPHEDVLLVGTGLTAVDVVLALRQQRHRGRMLAISRRGLLPAPHLAADDTRRRTLSVDLERLPRSARGVSRWLREETRRLEGEGVAWQCLVDAMRPITTAIWRSLDDRERMRFMRSFRPYWEVARHRAALEALAEVQAARDEGKVEVRAARVVGAAEIGNQLEVQLRTRGASAHDTQRFDRVVLCTGPDTDVRRWSAPLYCQLLADGALQADPLGIGVVTDATGRAIGAEGVQPWLYVMGGLRRPDLWETTSVPDLVRQAAALVDPLLARVRGSAT